MGQTDWRIPSLRAIAKQSKRYDFLGLPRRNSVSPRNDIKTFAAFTLAEVLITLGVIGIIAEMTLPTLIENVQDQVLKVSWKKEFSVINQAYSLVKQDHGGDFSEYFTGALDSGNTRQIFNEMKDKLLVSSFCNPATDVNYTYILCDTSKPLIDGHYHSMAGLNFSRFNLFYYQIGLNDGSNIYTRFYDQSKGMIWVDVNGYLKGPNMIGKDLFGMIMTKDKITPIGAMGTGLENTCNSTAVTCPSAYAYHPDDCAGAGCSAEYLYK